jgi:RNA polymerase sigma-70 factor (ECF subfamily)
VPAASAAAPATPEDITLARAQDEDLFAAVARLPKAQRDVIACRYLMDLSEEETAMVLGIPRGTVKSRLARGLARLEQSMHQEALDG